MAWWIWAIIGLVLLAAELFVPVDFYVFFLGIAALGVSAVAVFGLTESASSQLFVFSVFAVTSLVVLRRPLVARLKRSTDTGVGIETLIGETAVLLEDLLPGAIAKAELRGTTWSARAEAAERLRKGEICRVERVEGLVLWVRPEDVNRRS
jgi:membrane protein implicated in regulation of membrane protease activity